MKQILPALALSLSLLTAAPAAELPFYVGTYSKNGSKGIYHGILDTETGTAKMIGLAGEAKSPSFLAIHPGKKFLYAAIEASPSMVEAFAIQADGTLKKLNAQPSQGKGNCHVMVDPAGKNLLCANYDSGSIACFPIKDDGSLEPASVKIQQTGTGPDKARQEGPHAHSVYVLGDFVYSCDLGTDEILVYKFDPAKGTLTPNEPPSGKVPAGGGPRHLAFHPKGGFAYVCSEMTSAVTAFAHDAAKGTLTALQTLSTIPKGYAEADKNSTAEIYCHPNGKFVYVSNRGHNSLAVYAIGADGKLTNVEFAPSHVKGPRGFALSPDGQWLIAAGEGSNNLALHKIDPATGKLTFQKIFADVGAPVNVEFLK